MTIQVPKVETNDPRLLQDNSKQNSSDTSFEDKLNYEKARVGLSFSPLSQFSGFFGYAPGVFTPENQEASTYLFHDLQPVNTETPKQGNKSASNSASTSSAPQMFESVPATSFNRQLLQELLTRTNWLVPNLAALPIFAKAFAAGQLEPNYNLQSLIDQIVEQARLVKDKGKTELALTLKPEELGEILLKFSSQAGALSVQISSSAETKKLIDANRQELERAFKKAHLQVENLTIQEVHGNGNF